MRRRSQPYTPPHRRNVTEHDQRSPAPCQRTLDDLGSGHLQVLVTLWEGFDWSACPFNAAVPDDSGARTARCISLPDGDDHLAEELLRFFETASKGCEQPVRDRLRVTLPASISKERRRDWHRMAATLGLQSVSQGIGEQRQLHIGIAASLGPTGSSVSAAAKELWAAAQEAGGEATQRSLNEIQRMLDTNAITADLRQLSRQIGKAVALQELLMQNDAEGAVSMLTENPELIWFRLPQSEYPLVTAVLQGLLEVVAHVVSNSSANVLQQRTRKYQNLPDLVSRQKVAGIRQQLIETLRQGDG